MRWRCATAMPFTLKKPLIASGKLYIHYSSEPSVSRELKQILSIHTTLNQKNIWCLFLWHRPVSEASEENICTHISSHFPVHSSSFEHWVGYTLICSCASRASVTQQWNLKTGEECREFLQSRSSNSSPMEGCKDLKHAVACLKEKSRPHKEVQDKPPQQKLEISTNGNVRKVLMPGLMEVKIWLAHWTKIPTVQLREPML